jgi:hypothetical protein
VYYKERERVCVLFLCFLFLAGNINLLADVEDDGKSQRGRKRSNTADSKSGSPARDSSSHSRRGSSPLRALMGLFRRKRSSSAPAPIKFKLGDPSAMYFPTDCNHEEDAGDGYEYITDKADTISGQSVPGACIESQASDEEDSDDEDGKTQEELEELYARLTVINCRKCFQNCMRELVNVRERNNSHRCSSSGYALVAPALPDRAPIS